MKFCRQQWNIVDALSKCGAAFLWTELDATQAGIYPSRRWVNGLKFVLPQDNATKTPSPSSGTTLRVTNKQSWKWWRSPYRALKDLDQNIHRSLVEMLATTDQLSSFKDCVQVPRNNLQQANLLYTIFNNCLKRLRCTHKHKIQYTCVCVTNLSACLWEFKGQWRFMCSASLSPFASQTSKPPVIVFSGFAF